MRRLFVIATAAVLLLSAVVLGVQSQDSLAQAASNCQGIHRTVAYRDGSKQLLAYFDVSQQWCWNGRAVTYVSKPWTVGKVTKLGAKRGWRYDGLIRNKDYYFGPKGQSRRGHASFRQGAFIVCPKNTQCFQKSPQVQIYVYYNGIGYSKAKA